MRTKGLSNACLFCTLILIVSCGPFNKVDTTGTELPAQESEKQHLVLRSLLNKEGSEGYQELWVNGKPYPMGRLETILDTINPDYTIEIKNDSIAKKQLLILKTRP
ncbi:hypothetical protein K1F50_17130 [Muricauda oceani]|uniref:Uncharacterized protein n=1 Tax=Flagellimonas oceani TaxID=2698672 RepID=A0A6G7J4V4_9FLAO|nr:hypothetical protein [Allomuricauda oceani]MBW8244534.1 hypothetical protein [Allomuricauda oceani]QII45816.1 hypothetical protein GVT53_14410 [Allomuricauda oceani]